MTKAQTQVIIIQWLWAGILLVTLMVVVGGITRLTGSGLSMVEWKPITGIIPPLSEQAWQEEFDKYKQFPEYRMLNYNIKLHQFKRIFFWEYLHRLLGRLTGVAFLVPFIVFYTKGWLSNRLLKSLAGVFIIGACQGIMGWYMVKSGLSNVPHVSHFRLAAHHGMALLLIGYLYWLTLSVQQPAGDGSKFSRGYRLVTLMVFLLLCLQITFGALVAGLKAGYSYTNFPLMGNSFLPPDMHLQITPILYNGVVIQFIHRWLGFLVALGVLILFFSLPDAITQKAKCLTRWLLLVVCLQVALGTGTLMLKVPLIMGVIHQGVAIVLLLILLRLVYFEFRQQAGEPITPV